MKALLLIAVLLNVPYVVFAGSEPPKEGLKAEQLRAVQAVGQAVLAAKHSQAPNPELQQLRQHVEELQQTVDGWHKLFLTVDKTAIISPQSGQPVPPGIQEPTVSAKHSDTKAKIESVLTKMRQYRALIEIGSTPLPHDQQGLLKTSAVTKVKELETQVEAALKSAPDEQYGKMRALLENMTTNKKPAEIRFQDETPTISTIVRHRQ